MITCSNCGKEHFHREAYCIKCGQRLETASESILRDAGRSQESKYYEGNFEAPASLILGIVALILPVMIILICLYNLNNWYDVLKWIDIVIPVSGIISVIGLALGIYSLKTSDIKRRMAAGGIALNLIVAVPFVLLIITFVISFL